MNWSERTKLKREIIVEVKLVANVKVMYRKRNDTINIILGREGGNVSKYVEES